MPASLRVAGPALFLTLLWLPATAQAQQRPLVTEDPETVTQGQVLLEAGFDYQHDVTLPASGLTGNLIRLGLLGVSVGVGPIAEIQIDGGLYQHMAIEQRVVAPLSSVVTATGQGTSSVEDLVIGAKVRLAPERARRPSFGFRFATKLPNASNESGLGLDTTDFYASLLMGKTVQSVRLVGNIGVGILSDPALPNRQNDVLTYGVSFARAISQAAEVVGEINGRLSTRQGVPPPGTESRGLIRFGGRYTRNAIRGDVALILGVTSRDPDLGVAGGITYVFDAFRIP
jgi:hypothetical protein